MKHQPNGTILDYIAKFSRSKCWQNLTFLVHPNPPSPPMLSWWRVPAIPVVVSVQTQEVSASATQVTWITFWSWPVWAVRYNVFFVECRLLYIYISLSLSLSIYIYIYIFVCFVLCTKATPGYWKGRRELLKMFEVSFKTDLWIRINEQMTTSRSGLIHSLRNELN